MLAHGQLRFRIVGGIGDGIGDLRVPWGFVSLQSRATLAMPQRQSIADLDEPPAKVLSSASAAEVTKQRQEGLLDDIFGSFRRQPAGANVSSQTRRGGVEQ